jgi:hypothetical protein
MARRYVFGIAVNGPPERAQQPWQCPRAWWKNLTIYSPTDVHTRLISCRHQAKSISSHLFPTNNHRDLTITMPSAFSNPAWQPVLIPYVGQTPTDDYLRQTPDFGPWSRVYWHLVWSQIHARDLHRALFWVQVWDSPPRCLTRDVSQYLLIAPDE